MGGTKIAHQMLSDGGGVNGFGQGLPASSRVLREHGLNFQLTCYHAQ